jgi:pimeloyl-ACP methyl ester carboxylesterase
LGVLAVSEYAVVFPDSSEALIGIFTKPEENSNRVRPAVVFLNAGLLHRIGPNRLYVRMAREMAAHGFSSLRFDLSGIGDSPPRTDGLPLRNAVLRDVLDALDFLSQKRELYSFILIGLCSGADLAFQVALADKRVVGVVLIDGLPYRTLRAYVYDQVSRGWSVIAGGAWRKLFPWLVKTLAGTKTALGERGVPPRAVAEAGLHDLADRGVNLLIVYTQGRGYNYARQFAELFPSVPTDRIEVVYLKGAEHTFELLTDQDRLVRTVNNWTSRFDRYRAHGMSRSPNRLN